MRDQWLRLSNGVCFVGFAAVTVALWLFDTVCGLAWSGLWTMGFGVYLERRGM